MGPGRTKGGVEPVRLFSARKEGTDRSGGGLENHVSLDTSAGDSPTQSQAPLLPVGAGVGVHGETRVLNDTHVTPSCSGDWTLVVGVTRREDEGLRRGRTVTFPSSVRFQN